MACGSGIVEGTGVGGVLGLDFFEGGSVDCRRFVCRCLTCVSLGKRTFLESDCMYRRFAIAMVCLKISFRKRFVCFRCCHP